MDALDACSIQGWAGVYIWEELFLAISDFTMFMWCMLRLAWMGMVVFEQQGVDVCVHGKAACLLGVVPLDVNACKYDAHPVRGDCVVLLEGMQEVFIMPPFGVLDVKVINNEDKNDGPPFLPPRAGESSTLVLSMWY